MAGQNTADKQYTINYAEGRSKNVTHAALCIAFGAGLTAASLLPAATDLAATLSNHPALLLTTAGLATMRASHTITYNEVCDWVRKPFTTLVTDSADGGLNVEPNGHGWKRIVGEWLACPICNGTWVATFLTAIWLIYPPLAATAIVALGIGGANELLHYAKEWLEHGSRHARELSGYQNRINKDYDQSLFSQVMRANQTADKEIK